jgi:heptosyltransferase-2/heptosyltransferase-3
MKRLVINFARVGDMVLIIPFLRHLARDAQLELLGRPWGRAVLDGQSWLRAIHVLATPYRGHGTFDGLIYGAPLRALAAELRARAFDEIVVFKQESAKVMAWMRSWAGTSRVVTLDSGIMGGASTHPVDMYREALKQAGYDVAAYDPVPRIEVSAERSARGHARVAALGARVLSLQAGSSLTHRWYRRRPNLKGLTPGQWAGLLTRLFREGEADAVILHGSALEKREARAIVAAMPPELQPRLHDWTGNAPLEELPGIFTHVRALLSVDTGPAHIAAAVGCPALVVFGPSDPQRWKPRGPGHVEALVGSAPCQFCVETPRFRSCRANVCLSTLDEAAIHSAWLRLRARLPEAART